VGRGRSRDRDRGGAGAGEEQGQGRSRGRGGRTGAGAGAGAVAGEARLAESPVSHTVRASRHTCTPERRLHSLTLRIRSEASSTVMLSRKSVERNFTRRNEGTGGGGGKGLVSPACGPAGLVATQVRRRQRGGEERRCAYTYLRFRVV